MRKKTTVATSEKLAHEIVRGIIEKKGKDIVSINLIKVTNASCDYFVICHGDSNVHIESIADSVIEHVGNIFKEKPWHKEGKGNAQWILLDYVNVVVHIFQKETREYYRLEQLWADGEVQEIDFV